MYLYKSYWHEFHVIPKVTNLCILNELFIKFKKKIKSLQQLCFN